MMGGAARRPSAGVESNAGRAAPSAAHPALERHRYAATPSPRARAQAAAHAHGFGGDMSAGGLTAPRGVTLNSGR